MAVWGRAGHGRGEWVRAFVGASRGEGVLTIKDPLGLRGSDYYNIAFGPTPWEPLLHLRTLYMHCVKLLYRAAKPPHLHLFLHPLGGTDAVALSNTTKLDEKKIVSMVEFFWGGKGHYRPCGHVAVHGAAITVE